LQLKLGFNKVHRSRSLNIKCVLALFIMHFNDELLSSNFFFYINGFSRKPFNFWLQTAFLMFLFFSQFLVPQKKFFDLILFLAQIFKVWAHLCVSYLSILLSTAKISRAKRILQLWFAGAHWNEFRFFF
jgi:hypothetical protein